jgi:hypothetical protein
MTVRSIAPLFHVVPEVLRAQGIIDDVAQPAFVLEKPDGTRVTLNPAPINFDDYRRQSGQRSLVGLPQQAAPLYLSRRSETFWFTFLSDSKTLYIQYNEVQGSTQSVEGLSAFSERIATFLAQNDVQRVVVDIRNNFGGENSTYGPLLRLLSENTAINQPGKLFAPTGRSYRNSLRSAALWR